MTIQAPGSSFVLVTGTVSVSSAQFISVSAQLHDVTPGVPPNTVSPSISQFGSQGETTGPLTMTCIFPVTGAGEELPTRTREDRRHSQGTQRGGHRHLRPIRAEWRRDTRLAVTLGTTTNSDAPGHLSPGAFTFLLPILSSRNVTILLPNRYTPR